MEIGLSAFAEPRQKQIAIERQGLVNLMKDGVCDALFFLLPPPDC